MSRTRPTTRPAFTLFELVLTVLVIAIAAAILVPAVGNNLYSSRLPSAANVLASDIEFCASECITRPATPRAVVFDTTNNKYTLEDLTTGQPINHPADEQPYINDFATGRNAQLAGVQLTGIQMGSSTLNVLTFDAYGRPLITADMVITLTYNGAPLTVTVKQTTGDVTIP